MVWSTGNIRQIRTPCAAGANSGCTVKRGSRHHLQPCKSSEWDLPTGCFHSGSDFCTQPTMQHELSTVQGESVDQKDKNEMKNTETFHKYVWTNINFYIWSCNTSTCALFFIVSIIMKSTYNLLYACKHPCRPAPLPPASLFMTTYFPKCIHCLGINHLDCRVLVLQ